MISNSTIFKEYYCTFCGKHLESIDRLKKKLSDNGCKPSEQAVDQSAVPTESARRVNSLKQTAEQSMSKLTRFCPSQSSKVQFYREQFLQVKPLLADEQESPAKRIKLNGDQSNSPRALFPRQMNSQSAIEKQAKDEVPAPTFEDWEEDDSVDKPDQQSAKIPEQWRSREMKVARYPAKPNTTAALQVNGRTKDEYPDPTFEDWDEALATFEFNKQSNDQVPMFFDRTTGKSSLQSLTSSFTSVTDHPKSDRIAFGAPVEKTEPEPHKFIDYSASVPESAARKTAWQAGLRDALATMRRAINEIEAYLDIAMRDD